MIPAWILMVGVIVLVLGSAYTVRNQINGMIAARTEERKEKPKIWWYVDDSQVNARQWLDWGNRATREPNEPYLQICQARAQMFWGQEFEVVPVIGRTAALGRLGQDMQTGVPPALFMPWCRAAFLSKFGGLWMDGSVLPMADGAALQSRLAGADALTFGVDPDEKLATASAVAPMAGLSAGWAAAPGHPVWVAMEKSLHGLIGQGAQSWAAPTARRAVRTLWDQHAAGRIRVDRAAEISRDAYGRRLELDTLLGQTDWPDGTTEGGLWVPLPDGRDGLERASPWLWFLRLSPDQIRESDFVWARWATRV